MNKLSFDDEAHEYRIDGDVVPSVTGIIGATVGTGFEFLPEDKAEFVKQRGRAIHAAANFIAQGVEFEYDPRIEGWIEALRRFFREVKPTVHGVERTMWSTLYRYGGTLDLDLRLGQRRCLCDYKSSMHIERLKLQLGGYSQLMLENDNVKIDWGFGVELKENGQYRMTDVFDIRYARRDFLTLRSYCHILKRVGGNST